MHHHILLPCAAMDPPRAPTLSSAYSSPKLGVGFYDPLHNTFLPFLTRERRLLECFFTCFGMFPSARRATYFVFCLFRAFHLSSGAAIVDVRIGDLVGREGATIYANISQSERHDPARPGAGPYEHGFPVAVKDHFVLGYNSL